MRDTAVTHNCKHPRIGRTATFGLFASLLVFAGCGLPTQQPKEGEPAPDNFTVVASELYFEADQGGSIVVTIGAYGPAGETVSAYAIDMPEVTSRISITTETTTDCPVESSSIEAGYEVGSCQRWTFSPGMDAIPGIHKILVLPQSPSVLATTTSRTLNLAVRTGEDHNGTLAASSVSGKLGLWSVFTRDRSRWSWGNNDRGLAGVGGYRPFEISTDSEVIESVRPHTVFAAASAAESDPFNDGWIDMVATEAVGLGLSDDGRVFSWGLKENPVMGRTVDIVSEHVLTPGPIGSLESVSAVAAAKNTGFALIGERILSWGQPDSVLLGVASPADTTGFHEVEGLTSVAEISAGTDHVLARLFDGTVWGWGDNSSGQLGDGPIDGDYVPVPIRVSGLTEVSQIVAIREYSIALSDGSVYIWGSEEPTSGVPGDDRPVQISGFNFDTTITMISTEQQRECTEAPCPDAVVGFALDSDGQVWRWGDEAFGNDYRARLIPSLENVVSIGSDKAITGECSVGGYVWDLSPKWPNPPELIPLFGRADPNCPSTLFIRVEGQGIVSIDPNGLTCTDDCSFSVIEDADLLVTATPDAGSIFVGWEGSIDCGANNGVIRVSGAAQCVALFDSPANLSVTKSGSGDGTVVSTPAGIDCGADCEETYAIDTEILLLATPDANSVFAEWSGDAECTDNVDGAESTLLLSGDIHCEAVFTAKVTFTLTVARDGAGAGIVTADLPGINCGSDCSEAIPLGDHIVLTATPDAGSVYAGWSGDGDCGDPDHIDDATGKASVTVTGNMTCTATFDLESTSSDLTLTVNNLGDGHGRVTSTPAGIDDCTFQGPTAIPTGCNSADFTGVPTVTLSAEAIDGAFFEGWQGCDRTVVSSSGGNDCEVDAGGARTVEALFVF